MRRFLDELMTLLGASRRRRFIVLCAIGALSSLLEMFGLVLVFPLIKLLQDPTYLREVPAITAVYELFGFRNQTHFIIALSAGVFSLYAMKNVYFTGVYWLQRRFLMDSMYDATRALHGYYLSAPYEELIAHNASVLASNLRVAVPQTYYRVVLGTLNLIADVMAVIGIALVLVILNPHAMLLALFVSGVLSLLHYYFLGSRFEIWGRSVLQASRDIFRRTRESFEIFKEIRVLGKEAAFHERISESYRLEAEVTSLHHFLQQAVRPITEMVVLLAIFVVLAVVLMSESRTADTLAGLAVFAVAGVRLIPLLNKVFISYGGIRSAAPMMKVVVEELASFRSYRMPCEPIVTERLGFTDSISLESVSYTYPDAQHATLKGVSIRIEAGAFVGIVGPSGAGKSTLMDLILGLLTPGEGRVEVDGQDIVDRIPAWQQNLGYVPQRVEIVDDSLRANIALGVDRAQVNDARIFEVLRLASLDDWMQSLPQGLDAHLGDRGVRLSGGQRKRVGVARALYRDPQVLVLDEATADLDNETEHALTRTLSALKRAKTIIVIAHRLISVERCDRVFFMREGRIASAGAPSELYHRDEDFAEFVRYGQHERMIDTARS